MIIIRPASFIFNFVYCVLCVFFFLAKQSDSNTSTGRWRESATVQRSAVKEEITDNQKLHEASRLPSWYGCVWCSCDICILFSKYHGYRRWRYIDTPLVILQQVWNFSWVFDKAAFIIRDTSASAVGGKKKPQGDFHCFFSLFEDKHQSKS